jgi:hypothetical protein
MFIYLRLVEVAIEPPTSSSASGITCPGNTKASRGRPDWFITLTAIASPGCTVLHCKARPETEVNSPSLGLNTHLAPYSGALEGVVVVRSIIRACLGRNHL